MRHQKVSSSFPGDLGLSLKHCYFRVLPKTFYAGTPGGLSQWSGGLLISGLFKPQVGPRAYLLQVYTYSPYTHTRGAIHWHPNTALQFAFSFSRVRRGLFSISAPGTAFLHVSFSAGGCPTNLFNQNPDRFQHFVMASVEMKIAVCTAFPVYLNPNL